MSCEEGRLKTLYGISDPTDYELSQDDKYISEDLGGNAVYMTGYPGVTGLMGARPPSAFQFTRLNPSHNQPSSNNSAHKNPISVPNVIKAGAIGVVGYMLYKHLTK